MANEGFGLRINNARCDAGLSQVELAAAIQTLQANVSRWERERVTPGRRIFEALGLALGVTADWLQWGNQPPQVKIRRIFNRYTLPAEASREITSDEAAAIRERNKRKRRV